MIPQAASSEDLFALKAAARAENQREFSPVVVTPTFNNAGTLCNILNRIEQFGYPVIVVDDGSTDATGKQLADWAGCQRAIPVTVVTHARNRGKAAALWSGFAAAKSAGHTHVATIDTDGQLDPMDIPKLFLIAQVRSDALVLGKRRWDIPGCPRSSHFSWWMTALGIFLETGHRVLDSQCGLRVYPMCIIDLIRGRSGRYGFESEVVTQALWAGFPVVSEPITCRYLPITERVSHFKPWRDGLHCFFMHFFLTIQQVLTWPSRKSDHNSKMRGVTSPTNSFGESPLRHSAIEEWWNWVNPIAVWHQLRSDRFEQLVLAGALGIGAFVSNMPLGGWQILLAVYVARRMHVKLIPVLISSLLCLGSIGSLLGKLAIAIGYCMLHFSVPSVAVLAPEHLTHWQRLARVPFAWSLGAVIVGFFCNWIVLPVFERLFRLIPVRFKLDRS